MLRYSCEQECEERKLYIKDEKGQGFHVIIKTRNSHKHTHTHTNTHAHACILAQAHEHPTHLEE